MKILRPPFNAKISNDVSLAFPYETPRKHQLEVCQLIMDNIDSYDNFILSIPTGTGKSGIAITVAQQFDNSFIITHRRKLQRQYADEFGLPTLFGRANYDCNISVCRDCDLAPMCVQRPCNCYEAPCNLLEVECPVKAKGECTYYRAKHAALSAPHTILGSKFALIGVLFSEAFDSRDVAIYDEAHSLDDDLSSLITVAIRKAHLWELKVDIDTSNWPKTFEDIVAKGVKFIESPKGADFKSVKAKIMMIRAVHHLMHMYNEKNWIWQDTLNKRREEIYSFKPIWVSNFAMSVLPSISSKRVFMSATLNGDQLCISLGLDPKDCLWINVDDSQFPVKNRQIYATMSGNLTHKTMKDELPKVLAEIQTIVDRHPDDRILIVPFTYALCDSISTNLRTSRSFPADVRSEYQDIVEKYVNKTYDYSSRMKFYAFERVEHLCRCRHIRGSGQYRELDIDIKSYETVPASILVTPYLKEGYDGADDKCRVLVIPKVPYPDVSDPVISRRMTDSKRWYNITTAQSLVQTLGRGVRSETDHCVNYILDKQFVTFYGRARELFPKYIRDAILWRRTKPEETKRVYTKQTTLNGKTAKDGESNVA